MFRLASREHRLRSSWKCAPRRLKSAVRKSEPRVPYNELKVGVPKETWSNEKRYERTIIITIIIRATATATIELSYHVILFFIFRVALVPSSVEILKKHGWNVQVEHDAGTGAKFRNQDYETAGAEIVSKENAFASGLLCTYIYVRNT